MEFMRCVITIASHQFVEMVEVNEHGGIVIGRGDEATHYQPDVDLANCGGREKGVSRRHAALVHYHGAPHLIDLSSINGTYLNGQLLAPEQPSALDANNVVRLGTLEMRVVVA